MTITAATFLVSSFALVVAGVDAEALQHADQRLPGEDRGAQPVAGAGQADHQTVADQLVLAHALDVGDVLDAGPARAAKWRSPPERTARLDRWRGTAGTHGRAPVSNGMERISVHPALRPGQNACQSPRHIRQGADASASPAGVAGAARNVGQNRQTAAHDRQDQDDGPGRPVATGRTPPAATSGFSGVRDRRRSRHAPGRRRRWPLSVWTACWQCRRQRTRTERDRRARRHGRLLLAELAALQRELLSGGDASLQHLAELAEAVPVAADPALAAVMRRPSSCAPAWRSPAAGRDGHACVTKSASVRIYAWRKPGPSV